MTPRGSTEVFRFAPVVMLAATLVVAVVAPLVSTESAVNPIADVFAVVGLLVLGTVALVLAGMDAGTPVGGLGAGRALAILAVAQPALLLAMLAPAVRVGSTNLATIVSATVHDPTRVITPASLLAAVALGGVIIAETGRLPVDDPATNLEPTMVRRAMTLEYAGPDLAVIELASAMRLTILLALLANLFLPWGIATTGTPAALGIGVLALVIKVTVLGILLAASEVFLARLRISRVRELLAGSFLLASLALAASVFLGGPGVA
jgi:formate hydrogenlyase subunit 4